MVLISNFKDRVNDELTIQKMSRYRLSKNSGIPQTTLADYCTGKYPPSPDNLNKIANALGVNPLWLLGYDCSRGAIIDIKSEIIDLLDKMNKQQLQKLKKFLEIYLEDEAD